MINEEIRTEIMNRLRAAEEEHNVRIIYACESGSRAWGFASTDSDYDVRFIYVRDESWYLSFDIEYRRDVIEYPILDEIDCGGWDIKKALYLFTRTNGAFLEWLNSPIKYIEDGEFANNMRAIAPVALNKTALCYHYSHMARRNAQEYLSKDKVKLKKYFYILRPLLAIRFIEKYNMPPPVEFEKLVMEVAPENIVPSINELIVLKRSLPELGVGCPISVINEFIDSELDRHGEVFKGQGRPDIIKGEEIRYEVNKIFLNEIKRK